MPNARPRETAIYAVITGDIVGSTNLTTEQLASLRKTLHETVRNFNRNEDRVLKGPEFFRGDSWQVLLNKPGFALNLTLLIQANLIEKLNVQTRAAIGIGPITSMDKTLATSVGEAFTLSGHALENITGNVRLSGALPGSAGPLRRWFPAILHICGGLASSWTRRQAEAMGLWLSLVQPTHEAIAQRLKPSVTKQSVGDILTSANWHYLYEAMNAFHMTDWQFLSQKNVETDEDAAHSASEQKKPTRRPSRKRKA